MNWAFDDMQGQFYLYENFDGRVKGICNQKKEKIIKKKRRKMEKSNFSVTAKPGSRRSSLGKRLHLNQCGFSTSGNSY
jgi:hypothetical protein